ncbi:carbohydrate ABC transporter permease [Bifidobacterium callitrichos]|uniref:Carbohydrate ABC transporter permease n=2 Tax=Bifidobacterium callitrichos TaxID=762209 RepID=A0A5M9ZBJ3_9BIFI|nr:carbohydrate ABC transporter permease [Bifidobacterium callitrichos]KAA8815966.1 carbohydrate ABC transporter permease [Bifidobacterium callitrichos]KFI51410.1 binding-protein-dependent transport system inner membrane protein [Bifidobacterium callitrichos DSM 23973]
MTSATVQPSLAPKASSDDIPWNPKVRQQRTVSDWITDIVIWVILALVVVAIIYPLWFVIIASVSNQGAVNQGRVTFWPVGFSLGGYEKVFSDGRIWTGYLNTIIYSVVGTALNMIVTIPVAFALSRREFKPRRVILFLFTFTMFFAGGLIPNYLLFKQLGLLDNWLVFILPTAVSVWNVIIARSFFETSIPEDLHDASQIDGLGYWGYFLRIVLPLSSAIIAVLALYYFVGHWNDFFTGLVYIRDSDKLPLQNVLRSILLANQTGMTGQSSGGMDLLQQREFANQIKYGVIIVSTLPLLVLYPFLQKYFNKGVMIGAVKG